MGEVDLTIRSMLRDVLTVKASGQNWAPALITILVVGLVGVAALGFYRSNSSAAIIGVLLATACLLVGLLLGFLFGIPRSLQSTDVPPPAADPLPDANAAGSGPVADNGQAKAKQAAERARAWYGANTNLEQISDWLTKILVGVGLTQLTALPTLLDAAGQYFAPSLGITPATAVVIVIFFSVCGFLMGYLWTRLFLGAEFRRADELSSSVTAAIDNRVSEQFEQATTAAQKQAQVDANALSTVTQYLSDQDVSKFVVDDMKALIRKASPTIKVQIFYNAREVRTRSWQVPDHKHLVARTVPIFEALCEADTDKRFFQNHGQLGYALKDLPDPDYQRAEAELTIAIDRRGSASTKGFVIYELNRALCRIQLDPEFREGKPSTPENRARIYADLDVARTSYPDFWGTLEIHKWIDLNGAQDLRARN